MKKFLKPFALALALVLSFASVCFATEAAEPEHIHAWDYLLRRCADPECAEVVPCWDAEQLTYVHDFTDSDVCLVCGAARYCSNPEHRAEADYDKDEHEIASCGVPGHFICDELDHSAYRFDPDGHTRCFEEQTHHCDECGNDYTCAYSNSHVTCIKCGKPWCDKSEGDHTTTACGHRECIVYQNRSAHKKMECGHYACKKGDHTAAVCQIEGHWNCDGKKHTVCENCGELLCNGKNHTRLSCGHYVCDYAEEDFEPLLHQTFSVFNKGEDTFCTDHYICQHLDDDPEDHLIDRWDCGRPMCNGEDHFTYYACDAHTTCRGDDASQHAPCPGCGMFACADGYNASEHVQCPECGMYICDEAYSADAHKLLDCGHCACESGTHEKAACGVHWQCAEGYTADAHKLLDCGHYACESGAHEKAACGVHWQCAEGYTADAHKLLDCGHYACESGTHEKAACGVHWQCAEGYTADAHKLLDCGHYACASGDHASCACGGYRCDGSDHSAPIACSNGHTCQQQCDETCEVG